MDPALTAAVPQFHGGAEGQISDTRTTMTDVQIEKQQQRIHLTVAALVMLVAAMFISAAFLRFGA